MKNGNGWIDNLNITRCKKLLDVINYGDGWEGIDKKGVWLWMGGYRLYLRYGYESTVIGSECGVNYMVYVAWSYGVLCCGVVWCGVVWCDVMWCGMVWYGVVVLWLWCVGIGIGIGIVMPTGSLPAFSSNWALDSLPITDWKSRTMVGKGWAPMALPMM